MGSQPKKSPAQPNQAASQQLSTAFLDGRRQVVNMILPKCQAHKPHRTDSGYILPAKGAGDKAGDTKRSATSSAQRKAGTHTEDSSRMSKVMGNMVECIVHIIVAAHDTRIYPTGRCRVWSIGLARALASALVLALARAIACALALVLALVVRVMLVAASVAMLANTSGEFVALPLLRSGETHVWQDVFLPA
jgi:hypothetical protein